MTRITPFLLLLLFSSAAAATPPAQPYLYKVTLVQAAPGQLLELIDLYKQQAAAATKEIGDEAPLWMRHSQGDHWDLMILFPIKTYADYYQAERAGKRAALASSLSARFQQDIAWQEDLFAYGPPLAELRKAFAEGAFFHVEMFVALPGKLNELYKEREMENSYSKTLGEPENFIFTRDQGAAWDIFTIGVYRDLKHYAEGTRLSPQEQDAAARAAGFDSPAQIGPYLRRFIREHHDTLAVAIKNSP